MLLLLGLITTAWLLVEYTQNDVATDHFTSISLQEPSESQKFSASVTPRFSRVVRAVDNSGNAPMDEEPPMETSWMKELQELKELAAKDPDAALDRVAQMSEKEERVSALKAVCLQVAEKDPAKALTSAWALGLGHVADESSDGKTLEKLAGQWAVVDLAAAITWAGNQPGDEEERRDLIMKGIASVWAQTSPEDAAHLVATQMTPEKVQFEAAMVIVGRWAVRDYDQASAWVDLFPEGPIQERAKEELSKALTNRPPSETRSN